MFSKEDRPAGWRKGPPKGGEIPAIFVMSGIETLVSRFSNIREMKVLPIQSRLSQVADLACTMKRIARRLDETGMLAKSESYFFGGEKNFRKNWIKSLLKNEWL